MNNSTTIDGSHEKWNAVIEFKSDMAILHFTTKSGFSHIQGKVDATLGYDERETGIGELVMGEDDGNFIVEFDETTQEQTKEQVFHYLRNLYETNKERFAENIACDIDYYVERECELMKECKLIGLIPTIDEEDMTPEFRAKFKKKEPQINDLLARMDALLKKIDDVPGNQNEKVD